MNNKINKLVESGSNLIGGIIHNIDKKVLVIQNSKLKSMNLTFQQAMIIVFIYQYQDSYIYQKDLEIYLGLTNPSVTSLIKTMISKDLVYRIQDKKDGRYFHLHLTVKSMKLVDLIADLIYEGDNEITSSLSQDEIKKLYELLIKIDSTL